jgi:hypothetical protein
VAHAAEDHADAPLCEEAPVDLPSIPLCLLAEMDPLLFLRMWLFHAIHAQVRRQM